MYNNCVSCTELIGDHITWPPLRQMIFFLVLTITVASFVSSLVPFLYIFIGKHTGATQKSIHPSTPRDFSAKCLLDSAKCWLDLTKSCTGGWVDRFWGGLYLQLLIIYFPFPFYIIIKFILKLKPLIIILVTKILN